MQRLGECPPVGRLSWDVAALLAHFLFLFLGLAGDRSPVCEKDNTYLGKGPNLGSPSVHTGRLLLEF